MFGRGRVFAVKMGTLVESKKPEPKKPVLARDMLTAPEPSPSEPDEILSGYGDARDSQGGTLQVLQLTWEHRRFLGKTVVWGFVVCALIAFLIPKRYQSVTRLMPPDDRSGSMAMLAALGSKGSSGGFDLGTLATDALGIKSSGALFVGILQSRTVQDDLINKFDLRKVYWVSLWKKAREKLAARTEISEDRKTGIITIAVTDQDPQRASAMAKEYVSELNRVVTQLSTSAAHRERVFLEERLGEVQRDLESAEREFSQFASKNTAIDIKEQGKAMVGAAAELQGELIAAQSELEGLKQIYTDQNVRVRTVEARISELQHQLEKLGGKGDGLGTGEGDSLYPSIRKLPLLGATYADLYRRTTVQEVVFETLTKQYELAKVQEAKEIPSVKVLDNPDIPEQKSFPPRLVIIILGTGSVLLLAVLWVLGRAKWEEIDETDPRKSFAIHVYETAKTHVALAKREKLHFAVLGRFRSDGESEREKL